MPTAPRRTGFSLVELMVVVGVTALLLGLLVPALSKARVRARKATELSNLRLVGMGWTAYANQNNGAVLPGYLTTRTQQGWGVSYRFSDGRLIPPAPDFPAEEHPGGPSNFAGPWPWRLMPFLDHDEELLIGYRIDTSAELLDERSRAWEISRRPAYAYNGLFIGGWWSDGRRPWYDPARVAGASADAPGPPVRVVTRTLDGIRRASELIVFTSAGERTSGLYRYDDTRDDRDGTHLVVPPIITRHRIWGLPDREAAGGSAGDGSLGVTANVDGLVDVLHVYGNDSWGGNPFEFG